MANGRDGMNTGPNGPQITQDQVRAILIAQSAAIGRFQAPEFWDARTVALAAPAQIQLPNPMPLNRPAESIVIELALRVTVANNNMAAVFPEAPQTLLQSILLNGQHRLYGAQTPIDMSGATAYQWPSLFQGPANETVINGAIAAPASRPFVSPFTGLVGTHDMRITWNVPTGVMDGIGQSTKRDLASFLYQPADWGDTLRLQLRFGDASALGTPAAPGDVTISAFGSAEGDPALTVAVNYSILGPFANALDTGLVLRTEQFFAQFITAANRQRISQLQKNITTGVVLKSGTAAAGLTAGVNAFATLVDTQIDRTQIVVDNKPVKFNQSNPINKAYVDRMFAVQSPDGYFNLTFVDGQNVSLAYRGDGLAGGSNFEVISDILTSGATQNLTMVQEQILGGPFPALRPL